MVVMSLRGQQDDKAVRHLPDETMEQVRDLLFGDFARAYEERVSRLETRVRELESQGQSLEKEQQHSYPRGFNCTNYATYMQHTMHEETRGNPRHEVKYSEILAHPEREIYELGKFIGLDIDESDRMRLAKRVDPTLQHYFSSRPQYKGITMYVE